jgi:hypothetical protein
MKKMVRVWCAALACALSASAARCASTSAISVVLKMDEINYVAGERIRGVVDIKNLSPDVISVGSPDSKDRFFIEVFVSSDMEQLERGARRPFVAPFLLKSNEGQKLETFLADHYALREARRYMVRPVLVHAGKRYEGEYRSFDVVPGIKITEATQMFANRAGLSRVFSLVHWSRRGREHLFVTCRDEGASDRKWMSWDVGPMMRITKPVVSVLPGGEVVVLHRTGPDHFIRSEFWSMPDAVEFHSRILVNDPETAGQNRVKELYKDAGGVKPVSRPWWKFW